MTKAVFKIYSQNQSYLLPPSWEEKIEKNHPVRIISRIIDELDMKSLNDSYEGGGASSYQPKMLIKALVYSYMNNVYSSRKIEENIKSNIHLIWLCGGNQPDHNTINRFRTGKLDTHLKDIFKQIVILLSTEGLLKLNCQYVDGTIIEADANKYSFVWAKSLKTNKEKMGKQIDLLWQYVREVASAELSDTAPREFKEIDASKVKETVRDIKEALEGKEIPKQIKKKLNYIEKKYPEKFDGYEKKEEILNGRKSYSKTDTDATFMRTKEDHFCNGQLKPAYNVQISTNNQIITNYGIYQNPADTQALASHLDNFKELYGISPECVVADSGYGSDQNYEYLEQNGIKAYVKYNHFHSDEKGTRQSKFPFAADFLYYNKEDDYYVCPTGQHMTNIGTSDEANNSGYLQPITRYEANNCTGCPMRGVCHRSQGNRVIEINHRLNRHKQKARENLRSEEGIYHRRQRGIDTEPVFGNLKRNKNFRRFSLRGLKKVEIEFGLFAIAHNLKKKVA